MNKSNWLGISLFFSLIFMGSCGDKPTCLDQNSSYVNISFQGENGKAKDIIISSLQAIDNEDGFPEFSNDTTSSVSLPLNPGARAITFILTQPTRIDTLGLTYNVVAKLISPECGLDAAFSELDTSMTSFDQLTIIDRLIDKNVDVNIEIIH